MAAHFLDSQKINRVDPPRCSRIVATIATVVLALFASTQSALAQDRAKPNIIYILADDLGYGDLGCYGQKTIRTPNIDRLAAEGMKFTDHYAGSTVCAPSRCVVMTGKHTGHALIRGNGKMNLGPKDVTVAEMLKAAGYRTALCGKWGLGHEGSSGVPTKKGFDFFYGYMDQHHAHNFYPSFLLRNEERVKLKNVVPNEGRYGQGVASEKKEYSHDLIMAEALKFIEENHKSPFFLYLAITIPHANNEAGSKGMEVPDLGPYKDKDWPEPAKGFGGMIHRMDRDIGRLVELLKRLKIDDNTLVIFTSDNGPHNEGGHRASTFESSGLLKGTKRALYEGGIRVPMIARWPGKIAAGSKSGHASYFGDLFATAAELSGGKSPAGLDSISFVPTLLGKSSEQKQHKYLYWEFYEHGSAQAVRMGKWKAVRKPAIVGKIELYDLSKDIGEETNLADKFPVEVAKMEAAMKTAHVSSSAWKFRQQRGAKPKRKSAKP